MIERFEVGERMSQAVVHGGIVYLAGQVGTPGTSVAQQTDDILKSVDRLLGVAGSRKANILAVTIWLADMADFAEMNMAWDRWVDRSNPPARATGEAKLAAAGYKVEMIVTAAIDLQAEE